MATLHIPYYRSDVPVVRYTENINSGVMVIQPHDYINYIGGTLLTPTSNYFKTSTNQKQYQSILCNTLDNPQRLGSFKLPDKTVDGSWVLSYAYHDDNAKYTWTNIEDIALSKCFISSASTMTGSLIIPYNNSTFHFDNEKYVYNLLIDGYVDINIDITNDIVKQNSNIFILINDSSSFSISNIQSIENNETKISLPLFYKYTANITDTTVTKKRLFKFVPDFKTPKSNNEKNICLTLISASMENSIPNNINKLQQSLNIDCNVMITENLRIPTS